MTAKKARYFLVACFIITAAMIAVTMPVPSCEGSDPHFRERMCFYDVQDLDIESIEADYYGVALSDVHSVGTIEIRRLDTSCPPLFEWINGLERVDEIHITSSLISDEGLLAIVRDDLLCLRIHSCPDITSDGILALPVIQNLKRLDLECSGVDDRAIPWIEALPSLQSLLVRDSGIRDLQRLRDHMEARGGELREPSGVPWGWNFDE